MFAVHGRPALFALVTVTALAVLAVGCGDNVPPLSSDPLRNVMVIDDGFDTSLPVFRERIAAAYTITCSDPAASGDDDPADDDKAALLAELAAPDDRCHLTDGVVPKENPFADLEPERAAWNDDIRHNVWVKGFLSQAPDGRYAAIIDRLTRPEVRFHGTATSGIIAHQNAAAQLVLVERHLDSQEEASAQFTCLTQDSLDRTLALFSDAEVRAAYLARPLSTMDQELRAARVRHGVGMVNESFGTLTRYALELLQQRAGCAPVTLAPYFAAIGELEAAYEQAHAEAGVLVVQAAGNDMALIRGPGDDLDCRLGDPSRLLVGSYGRTGARSSFTNFGSCVNAYAPGEDVVTHLPGDWLFPLDGTSFAAPLLARLIAEDAPRPFAADTARATVIHGLEPNGNVPRTKFPRDLLYVGSPLPSADGAARSALGTQVAPARLVDPVALGKILWPLRLARGRHPR
jgi:subtilisin family serine protease